MAGVFMLLQVLPVMGFVQGLFLSFLIFKNNLLDRRKSIFLISHILIFSSLLILPTVEQELGWQYAGYIDSLVWILFPTLYLYVLSFRCRIRKKDLLVHLSIFVPAFLVENWFFNFHAEVIFIDGIAELQHSTFFTILSFFKWVYLGIYLFFCYRLLRNHDTRVKSSFSNSAPYDLNWVYNLIWLMVAILIFAGLMFLISYSSNMMSIRESNLYVYILVMVHIYYAFYKGMEQRDFVTPMVSTGRQVIDSDHRSVKYQRNKLDEDDARAIFKKVRNLIYEEELFLDSELTLQQVADKAATSSYKISQSISQSGLSFYELVNSYRVERAKELLLDPKNKHFTILAIAYEAGFNSKSTFNNIFKKITGVTPSQFLKLNSPEEALSERTL
jgi:AraC-like DNA-binding protein